MINTAYIRNAIGVAIAWMAFQKGYAFVINLKYWNSDLIFPNYVIKKQEKEIMTMNWTNSKVYYYITRISFTSIMNKVFLSI